MTQHTHRSSTTSPTDDDDHRNQHRRESIATCSQDGAGEDILRTPTTTSSATHSGLHHVSTSRSARLARNERRASLQRANTEYDIPASYQNLDDVYGEPPVQNPDEEGLRHVASREDSFPGANRPHSASTGETHEQNRQKRMARRRSSSKRIDYDLPDVYTNLDELAAASPIQNPDEERIYRYRSLEEQRNLERVYSQDRDASRSQDIAETEPNAGQGLEPEKVQQEATESIKISRLATQIYTISYLVLFSIFGTLARLALQALTTYPGAPLTFASAWPNFAGSLLMGFLFEDRMLFRDEWGTPTYERQLKVAQERRRDEESGSSSAPEPIDLAAAKKAHMATKKTIPLYIGLATGFCGSFTSFSSFIRDIFLALSNELASPDVDSASARNGGYDFMALVAVLLITMALSLSALFIGAHLAIALEPHTPSLPFSAMRKILDPLSVILAFGCWLGAILLSALPPDRFATSTETERWRGRVTLALCLAPFGCLGRFYLSLYLNGKSSSFPVGTFAANVAGTAILGMAWDLQHAPVGGAVGCQFWQGIMDGFCGCLTTVSTFVAELTGLRRRHAYVYGGTSVLVSLVLLVAIMGGLKWSVGAADLACIT